MFKLYQRERCPYCKPVRELLTDLGVSYININVAKERSERKELIELTGVPFVPALHDGDHILAGRLEDNQHILEYIQQHFSNVKQDVSAK
ncbi:glutaredoxin [Paenibacillus illinoisensis]|uniref:glutaredoxin family protein n=1 Tax=Paenibacillus illinoisensis TaxID=59845 RepID=UPI00301D837B